MFLFLKKTCFSLPHSLGFTVGVRFRVGIRVKDMVRLAFRVRVRFPVSTVEGYGRRSIQYLEYRVVDNFTFVSVTLNLK